jgi:hypothetical protein
MACQVSDGMPGQHEAADKHMHVPGAGTAACLIFAVTATQPSNCFAVQMMVLIEKGVSGPWQS